MSQAFVQEATNFNGTASSVAQAFASNNTLGNALVITAVCGNPGVSISSVTDTQGNTYNQVGTTTSDSATAQADFIALNCKAGANTVTVAWASSVNFAGIYVSEYSGVSGAGTFTSATGLSGTAPATPNLTVPAGGGIVAIASVETGQALSAGTSFTIRYSQVSSGLSSEDWLNATAGSQAVAFATSASANWVMSAFILTSSTGTSQTRWMNRHRKLINKR